MLFILSLLLVIGLLIWIYQTAEDKTENALGLKIVGYFILGTFTFSINHFHIPLGFIIYLIVMHPETNNRAKRYAALVGLVGYLLRLL
jgi:uncharacterized membrane protein